MPPFNVHPQLFLLALVLIPFENWAQEWREEPKLLGPRSEFGNVVVEGKLILMGGIFNSRSGPSSVEVYDFEQQSWSTEGDMPIHRNHFNIGSAVYGDEIWVCGGKRDGNGRNAVADVDILNFKTQTWRKGPELPTALWGAPTVVIGNEIHIMGGSVQAQNAPHGLHFVLDLGKEDEGWMRAADLPIPRIHVAAVPYKGKIWVIGGEIHHNHTGDTKTVQVYDPTTDTWDLTYPELPQARSHSEWATFVHDDRIYSVAGIDHSQDPRAQETIYRYSDESQQWERYVDLPEKLAACGAKVYRNRLYVYGGGIDTYFKGDQRTMYSYPLGGDPPSPSLDTLTISLRNIFLEGYLKEDTQEMTDELSQKSLLPLEQPFGNSIWQYKGTEVLGEIPGGMTDWVLVSIRDSSGLVLASQASMLTTDGSLKQIGGQETISFPSISGSRNSIDSLNFLISIHPRNHLSIVFRGKNKELIDPLAGSAALGIEQLKAIEGTWVLHCGDIDGNGIINNLDFNLWKQNSAAINRYLNIDMDGNGIVNNQDFNLWSGNRSKVGSTLIQP